MSNSIIGTKAPSADPVQMINQIKQFSKTLKGDPQQMVMKMVQSGQISNPQLQQAVQMAKQIQSLIK